MSNSEQFTQPLPINDNVVVKLPSGTQICSGNNILFYAELSSLYTSTNEFERKLKNSTLNALAPKEILAKGIEVEILEPGKQWKSGKVRCRLVLDFIPDEQDNNLTSSESVSPLDDLRKMNL